MTYRHDDSSCFARASKIAVLEKLVPTPRIPSATTTEVPTNVHGEWDCLPYHKPTRYSRADEYTAVTYRRREYQCVIVSAHEIFKVGA